MENKVKIVMDHGKPQGIKTHESQMVGILFEYNVGSINYHDSFTCEYGRLIGTIDHQKTVMNQVRAEDLREAMRTVLKDAMEHKVEGCPENLEFIRTIVINWLSTYQSPSKFISKFPNSSIGFVFSVNDHQKDPMIFTSDFNSFLKILQTMSINNVKNLN